MFCLHFVILVTIQLKISIVNKILKPKYVITLAKKKNLEIKLL